MKVQFGAFVDALTQGHDVPATYADSPAVKSR